MSDHSVARLTVAEVAGRLGVSDVTVRRWIAAGELAALRIGGRAGYRIRPEDVEAFERRRATVATKAAGEDGGQSPREARS